MVTQIKSFSKNEFPIHVLNDFFVGLVFILLCVIFLMQSIVIHKSKVSEN